MFQVSSSKFEIRGENHLDISGMETIILVWLGDVPPSRHPPQFYN